MSVLEMAARALLDRGGYTEHGPVVPEGLSVELARAVLVAIRDNAPTVHKVEATVDGSFSDIVTIHREGWENLIDAILSEPNP